MADSIPSRETYEGETGGWADGRLGQAYDLIWATLTERNRKSLYHPVLNAIEDLDQEFKEES